MSAAGGPSRWSQLGAGLLNTLMRRRFWIGAALTLFSVLMMKAVGVEPVMVATLVLSAAFGAFLAALLRDPDSGWWWQRRPVVDASVSATPPLRPRPRLNLTFRGRKQEIKDLLGLHEQERRARERGASELGSEPDTNRPVVLCIYGMPGVGKTELARELARRLAPAYPDGPDGDYVFEHFTTAGEPRPPAEILKSLLLKLGRPEADIPADADSRRSLLRTMTKDKQIVFVFDAARNRDQVLSAMPAEPGSTVIITSRRDLAPVLELSPGLVTKLTVPSALDALDMLAAYGKIDWLADADAAIELIDLCGRLPPAIKSAGQRISVDGTPLRNVVSLLRPLATRLERLDRPGHNVTEGIATEFERLSPEQRQALCRLTLVRSRTFVPWVLGPLMGVNDDEEAANQMALLASEQLLDQAEADSTSGLARYEFSPLVRLFAEARLCARPAEQEAEVRAARDRLRRGYLEFARAVLLRMDIGYTTGEPWHWVPRVGGLRVKVASQPERGIRLEYGNLVQAVLDAGDGSDPACWLVAMRLDGSVPEGIDFDRAHCVAAFDRAQTAAKESAQPLAALDVGLARASHLIAIEDYPEALRQLGEIQEQAHALALSSDEDTRRQAEARAAKAGRTRVVAFLQMGSYGRARAELANIPGPRTGDGEDEMLALLQAESELIPSPEPIQSSVDIERVDDPILFRYYLNTSEAARRKGDWPAARQALDAVLLRGAGDQRRVAAVNYRLGRLCIEEYNARTADPSVDGRAVPGVDRTRRDKYLGQLGRLAVSHAAQAVVAFQAMGNQVGVIRARCLQIRALAAAGRLVEAERLACTVRHELPRYCAPDHPARLPLEARYCRAEGEWQLHEDASVPAARRSLKKAAAIYGDLQDFANQEAVWRLLRQLTIPDPARNGVGLGEPPDRWGSRAEAD